MTQNRPPHDAGAESFPAQRKAERPDGQRAAETREDDRTPPAGVHATPRLTDPDKTPGTGALPDDPQGDVDPGAG